MPNLNSLPKPARRPLRVFAFDPSRGRRLGNEMQLNVRYRELNPGPAEAGDASDQVAVVDYDASRKTYYQPVNLDDPYILIPNGLTPCEADPRFHQQMVYAVACDTIEQFENALGRRIHWHRAERNAKNPPKGWLPEDILTLNLYPHAMHQANAFYSREAHGIQFGYFRANEQRAGNNLPGQMIFTCLSHDVIVHEMTHAILDGMRGYFMEQTNPDVAAFHEAFADIAALFRHFSHREVLMDAIQRTGGRLYTPALQGDSLADQAAKSWLSDGSERNPLLELAGQFGEASGLDRGLRSAIGKPKTMKELQREMDCHERGSILVAAVFEAFFNVYITRAATLFRIYRSAGGTQRADVPVPLAEALCDEATRTAEEFFRSCVRALDYLPPVDVTFGDFLRAVLTSEMDFDPTDTEGTHDAWMQAFRRREIMPDDATAFSEEALRWTERFQPKVPNLPYGGPLGLSPPEKKATAAALRSFIDANRTELKLHPRLPYTIPSFHPLYRVARNGNIRWDMVVEIVQETQPHSDSEFAVRGGTTMIISSHSIGGGGKSDEHFLRYVISKPLTGPHGERRIKNQGAFQTALGLKPAACGSGARINFALLHEGA